MVFRQYDVLYFRVASHCDSNCVLSVYRQIVHKYSSLHAMLFLEKTQHLEILVPFQTSRSFLTQMILGLCTSRS